jgi:hypothetical protein
MADGSAGGGGSPDTTPPGVVTDLAMAGIVYQREDGTLVSGFDVSWTPPADPDVVGFDMELDSDPAFSHPQVRTPSESPFRFEPVTAMAIASIGADATPVTYYARVRAFDGAGNKLAWDDPTTPPPVDSGTAPTDPWAPDIPVGLTTIPGYRQMGVTWSRVDFADLARYGVRYAVDDGTGLAPDTGGWVSLTTYATMLVIAGLIPGQRYWFQVRAIDRSGQVRDYADPPTNLVPIAVYAQENPDTGWTAAVSGVPASIAVEDVSPLDAVQTFLNTGVLDASVIDSGVLRLSDPALGPMLEVRDGVGRLIAQWSDDGLLLFDPEDTARAMWFVDGELRTTDGYTGDHLTTDWVVSVGAEGLNAAAITSGRVPGGHNILPNAGFEMFPFPVVAPTSKVWTATADWATGTSQVNVTTSGADLTLTTATY